MSNIAAKVESTAPAGPWCQTKVGALWFLLALCGVLVSGCQPKDDVIWRFGLASAPLNLDPRFATDAASVRVNALVYERLVEFDAQSMPIPSLATWAALAPTHYRITLREPRSIFHDGETLTARDVVATYRFVLDPANSSPHRGALVVIDKIEAPNDGQVDFFLTAPDPIFPSRLTLGIVPAHLIESGHRFQNSPLGSGPFKFGERPDETRLRLIRRTDDQQLEFVTVKDPTVRVLKLLRGEIGMTQNDLQPELVRYLESESHVEVMRAPGTNFSYLGFNMQDPLLSQRLVRAAIAHGIDREAIIEHLWGGAARGASALLPPEHWAGSADVPRYDYDPQRARELLREAGYDGKVRLKLTYKTSSDAFRVRLATIIQDQLGKIGIDVEVQSYDWATFYGDIKAGRFQMFSLSWVGVKSPDIFRYVFHSAAAPPEGANRGRFSDGYADYLIEAAEKGATLEDQAHFYRLLQFYLSYQLPYVPLWFEDHVYVGQDRFRGYVIAPDGNFSALGQVERLSQTDGWQHARVLE